MKRIFGIILFLCVLLFASSNYSLWADEKLKVGLKHHQIFPAISKLDLLLHRQQDPFFITPCSTFAHLMSLIYEKNNFDIELFFRDAFYYGSDLPVVLNHFLNGMTFMRGSFSREKQLFEKFFIDLIREKFPAEGELIQKFGLKKWWRKLKNEDPKLLRLQRPFQFLWLTTHGGEPAWGGESLKTGYVQLDSDKSGRRDHLLANFFISYVLQKEKYRRSMISNWLGLRTGVSDFFSGYSGYIVENISGHAVSETDMAVNFSGADLGMEYARIPSSFTREKFEQAFYVAICDESFAKPVVSGPLIFKKRQSPSSPSAGGGN